MVEAMPAFLARFQGNDKYAPDLFKLLSEVLRDIFAGCGDVPDYVKVYGLEYYTDKVNVEENREKLLKRYNTEGDSWEINRKLNTVTISFDAAYKADHFQRDYKDDCGIEYFGGMKVVLDLEKTEKFLGIKLKEKGFFDRLMGK